MKKIARMMAVAALRLRGVKVTALVGKSGSGKSFRARLIAQKRGIGVIIDDGLVISGGSILTGHWAKKERTLVASVRRALFDEEAHAQEAREALRNIPLRGVLITATSRRMAQRIARNIWLPQPAETISIEEVATRHEIAAALRRRRRRGVHASPVPEIRVRRRPLSFLRSLLKLGGRNHPGRARIAAPRAGPRGSVFFSEAAVTQMTLHCVQEFDAGIHVRRISMSEDAGMTVLEISLGVPGALGGSGRLHELRDAITHGLEHQTGLIIREVRLVVEEIAAAGRPRKARPRKSD